MTHLRKGGFADVEYIERNGAVRLDPGRTPLPKNVSPAADMVRRIETLKGMPVAPLMARLAESSDVEWRG